MTTDVSREMQQGARGPFFVPLVQTKRPGRAGLDIVCQLLREGLPLSDQAVLVSLGRAGLDIVCQLLREGLPLSDQAVLVSPGRAGLDIVCQLLREGLPVSDQAVLVPPGRAGLDIVCQLLREGILRVRPGGADACRRRRR